MRYQLTPMDLGESVTYLRHHLALAGRTDPLIADDACARLHKASLGLPRALNNAAIAALIAAAADAKVLVDDDCARKAVAELGRLTRYIDTSVGRSVGGSRFGCGTCSPVGVRLK